MEGFNKTKIVVLCLKSGNREFDFVPKVEPRDWKLSCAKLWRIWNQDERGMNPRCFLPFSLDPSYEFHLRLMPLKRIPFFQFESLNLSDVTRECHVIFLYLSMCDDITGWWSCVNCQWRSNSNSKPISLVPNAAFPPEITSKIPNVSVAVGRDALFTCHVKNLGDFKVRISTFSSFVIQSEIFVFATLSLRYLWAMTRSIFLLASAKFGLIQFDRASIHVPSIPSGRPKCYFSCSPNIWLILWPMWRNWITRLVRWTNRWMLVNAYRMSQVVTSHKLRQIRITPKGLGFVCEAKCKTFHTHLDSDVIDSTLYMLP